MLKQVLFKKEKYSSSHLKQIKFDKVVLNYWTDSTFSSFSSLESDGFKKMIDIADEKLTIKSRVPYSRNLWHSSIMFRRVAVTNVVNTICWHVNYISNKIQEITPLTFPTIKVMLYNPDFNCEIVFIHVLGLGLDNTWCIVIGIGIPYSPTKFAKWKKCCFCWTKLTITKWKNVVSVEQNLQLQNGKKSVSIQQNINNKLSEQRPTLVYQQNNFKI